MSGVRLRRRELLGAAGAAGAAALAPALLDATAARAAGNPDADLIERFVRYELLCAVIYERLAQLPLDTATRELMALLARHERDHAAVLLNAAEYLGGPPVQAPTLAAVLAGVPALGRVRSRHDALVLAGELEGAQLRGYYDGQQQLSDTKLLQQTATVMCSDGQHAVLVRSAAGQEPLPAPYEIGAT